MAYSRTQTQIRFSVLALIGGTRALLGGGIGLLLGDRLRDEQKRAVGWTLFIVGAITTVPLVFEVMRRRRVSTAGLEEASAELPVRSAA